MIWYAIGHFPYPTSFKTRLNVSYPNHSTIFWTCYNLSPTGKRICLQKKSERSGNEIALIIFMNCLMLSEIWKLRKKVLSQSMASIIKRPLYGGVVVAVS